MNIFFFIFMFYNLYLFSQDKIETDLNSEDSIAYYDLPQFEVLDFKNQDTLDNDLSSSNLIYFKKVVQPKSDEIKNHNEYLKRYLKKNFFS